MGKMKQFPKVKVVSMRLTDEEYTRLKNNSVLWGEPISETLRYAVNELLVSRHPVQPS